MSPGGTTATSRPSMRPWVVVSAVPNALVHGCRVGVPSGGPEASAPPSSPPAPVLASAPPVPVEDAAPPLPPLPSLDELAASCADGDEQAPAENEPRAPRTTSIERARRDSMGTRRLRLGDRPVKAWKNPRSSLP